MNRLLPAALAAFLLAPTAQAESVATDGKARNFTHAMKAGAIAEECVRLEAGRSRPYTWTSDAPVDFNIHYHRGKEVTFPVKADGLHKDTGRFTATAGEAYCWMWTARGPARVTGTLGAEE